MAEGFASVPDQTVAEQTFVLIVSPTARFEVKSK
jgi:hypothetical protein